MWTELVVVLAGLLLLVWSALLWCWRDSLRRLWIEPVLRRPVLVIESDDWGPGPVLHAERLASLVRGLERHRDGHGHPALMTLGVVLAVPDGAAMARSTIDDYRRIELDDPRCAPVRERMLEGVQAGVFALQLHGMEHYWPPALLAAAHRDEALRAWFFETDFPAYETLPPPLQSRWIDTAQLPSRPLDPDLIRAAVKEETAAYHRVFGRPARVVVPPTFVWTRAVEEAWMDAGIEVIITPGRRYTGRDGSGLPAGVEGPILNGEPAGNSARYLVRDIYFEPARGHEPTRVLDEMHRHYRLGRPALLETHRNNFTGEEADFQRSLARMETLLSGALQAWPGLHFLSPEALARLYHEQPQEWFANHPLARLHVWLRRLAAMPRLHKLACFSGLALPALLLWWLSAAQARREEILS
jgi:hypothetical protein